MDDNSIIELYWERKEAAITATEEKYGRYCRSIAFRILCSEPDSEECVNDTWLRVWQAIPPQRPALLRAFLGKITRNLALNRWALLSAEKRGGGQVPLALEELHQCLPCAASPEEDVDALALTEALRRFLSGLKPEARRFFVGRYWHFRTIREIARQWNVKESKVKMSLLRSRKALAEFLAQEGFSV